MALRQTAAVHSMTLPDTGYLFVRSQREYRLSYVHSASHQSEAVHRGAHAYRGRSSLLPADSASRRLRASAIARHTAIRCGRGAADTITASGPLSLAPLGKPRALHRWGNASL